MATKFALINQGERISMCSEMLPSRMQCTRAGEFHVLDAESNKVRQVCRTHAILIRTTEQQAARVGAQDVPMLSNNEVLLEKLNQEIEEEKVVVQEAPPEKEEEKKPEEKSEVKSNEQPSKPAPKSI